MNKVYVVGGGPSLMGIDMRVLTSTTTIAVNKAAFYLANPSYFITMDYTALKKLDVSKLKSLNCPRFFILNFAEQYIQVRNGAVVDIRTNLVYSDIYDCFDSIVLSRFNRGIGKSLRDFRSGSNSGYCALQLAIALGYTDIYLLGIDLVVNNGHTHFHNEYNESPFSFAKKLPNYYENFVLGIREIHEKLPLVHVSSCSSLSPLNTLIPYIALENTL